MAPDPAHRLPSAEALRDAHAGLDLHNTPAAADDTGLSVSASRKRRGDAARCDSGPGRNRLRLRLVVPVLALVAAAIGTAGVLASPNQQSANGPPRPAVSARSAVILFLHAGARCADRIPSLPRASCGCRSADEGSRSQTGTLFRLGESATDQLTEAFRRGEVGDAPKHCSSLPRQRAARTATPEPSTSRQGGSTTGWTKPSGKPASRPCNPASRVGASDKKRPKSMTSGVPSFQTHMRRTRPVIMLRLDELAVRGPLTVTVDGRVSLDERVVILLE